VGLFCMAAAVLPVRCFSLPERILEMSLRTRGLSGTARALIVHSGELCEVSGRLVQESADLREPLHENMLNTWSRREHWQDQSPGL
jgi:hypothetical protein